MNKNEHRKRRLVLWINIRFGASTRRVRGSRQMFGWSTSSFRVVKHRVSWTTKISLISVSNGFDFFIAFPNWTCLKTKDHAYFRGQTYIEPKDTNKYTYRHERHEIEWITKTYTFTYIHNIIEHIIHNSTTNISTDYIRAYYILHTCIVVHTYIAHST